MNKLLERILRKGESTVQTERCDFCGEWELAHLLKAGAFLGVTGKFCEPCRRVIEEEPFDEVSTPPPDKKSLTTVPAAPPPPTCDHYREEVLLPCQKKYPLYLTSRYGRERDDAVTPDVSVWLASSWLPRGAILGNDGTVLKGPDDPAIIYVNWADGGALSLTALCRLLEAVQGYLTAGKKVEIGCIGAHGRTGTLVAALVMLCKKRAADAVEWLWDNYCNNAVETKAQMDLLYEMEQTIYGTTLRNPEVDKQMRSGSTGNYTAGKGAGSSFYAGDF